MEEIGKIYPERDDLKYLQDTLYVIGGKWKLSILLVLGQGTRRFNQIKSELPGISSRKLSQELKELEINGIIECQRDSDSIVKTNYEVVHYCNSFKPIISAMIQWGKEHRENIR